MVFNLFSLLRWKISFNTVLRGWCGTHNTKTISEFIPFHHPQRRSWVRFTLFENYFRGYLGLLRPGNLRQPSTGSKSRRTGRSHHSCLTVKHFLKSPYGFYVHRTSHRLIHLSLWSRMMDELFELVNGTDVFILFS